MKLSKKEVERRERLRQDETRRELEKVKKRRIVRRLCSVLVGIGFHDGGVVTGEGEGEGGQGGRDGTLAAHEGSRAL